jgi:hypothetical protein
MIYLTRGDTYMLEHEQAHCRGYDHPGESTMRDAWARWKASGGR